MLEQYRRILDTCEPYLVITRRYRSLVSMRPLGIEIAAANVVDPHDVGSAAFLSLVQRMDDLIHQPVGMKMPRWVFYDCAEMPGAIFGFGRRARALPGWVRAAVGVDDGYDGLVPLSNLILIPMLPPGAFLSYSLCSVNEVCPGGAPASLRLVTKALGLKVFPVRRLFGTTQWCSPTLGIHARFGPLDLLSAYTPAHSLATTLTFRIDVDERRVEQALVGGPSLSPGTFLLDADDEAAMRRIQVDIEAGARYRVVGQPIAAGALTLVPLAQA